MNLELLCIKILLKTFSNHKHNQMALRIWQLYTEKDYNTIFAIILRFKLPQLAD